MAIPKPSLASRPDGDLLRRVRAGEPEALAALYDRHGPRLYGLACLIGCDPVAAETAVQDVFVHVWQTSTHGDGFLWLAALVRQRCLTRDPARSTAAAAPTAAPTAERERNVREAVAALPDEQREALNLAYFKGLTRQEIAARLKVSDDALHTAARLGLNRLLAAMPEA